MRPIWIGGVALVLALSPQAGGGAVPAWVDLNPNVRAASMGGTGSGYSLGSDSVALNPAFLGWMRGADLVLMHNAWLLDASLEHAAFGGSISHGLGGAILGDYVSLGSVQGTLVGPDGSVYENGLVHPRGVRLGAGLGKQWGDLGLGASLQSVHEYGIGATRQTIVWGAGMAFVTRGVFSGGVYIQGDHGDDSPSIRQTVSLRPALSVRMGRGRPSAFLGTLEGSIHGNDPKGSFKAGVEWSRLSKVFLRCGYRYFMDNSKLGGFRGLTAGAGWNTSSIQWDYAYTAVGSLGGGHQFSVQFILPGKAAPAPANRRAVSSSFATAPASATAPVPAVKASAAPPPTKAPVNPTRAVPAKAESMMAWYQKGQAAYLEGRYPEAAQALEKAVAIQDAQVKDFYYAEAYSTLGKIQQRHGTAADRLTKAKTYYQKALEIDPETESAQSGLKSLEKDENTKP